MSLLLRNLVFTVVVPGLGGVCDYLLRRRQACNRCWTRGSAALIPLVSSSEGTVVELF